MRNACKAVLFSLEGHAEYIPACPPLQRPGFDGTAWCRAGRTDICVPRCVPPERRRDQSADRPGPQLGNPVVPGRGLALLHGLSRPELRPLVLHSGARIGARRSLSHHGGAPEGSWRRSTPRDHVDAAPLDHEVRAGMPNASDPPLAPGGWPTPDLGAPDARARRPRSRLIPTRYLGPTADPAGPERVPPRGVS
jgi:hypothetical protein